MPFNIQMQWKYGVCCMHVAKTVPDTQIRELIYNFDTILLPTTNCEMLTATAAAYGYDFWSFQID